MRCLSYNSTEIIVPCKNCSGFAWSCLFMVPREVQTCNLTRTCIMHTHTHKNVSSPITPAPTPPLTCILWVLYNYIWMNCLLGVGACDACVFIHLSLLHTCVACQGGNQEGPAWEPAPAPCPWLAPHPTPPPASLAGNQYNPALEP